MTGETIQGLCGPVAINTKLGWVLFGPAETVEGDKSTISLTAHTLQVNNVEDEEPDAVLQSFWELASWHPRTRRLHSRSLYQQYYNKGEEV